MPSVPITKIPNGMRQFMHSPPSYALERIEVWREGWSDTKIIDPWAPATRLMNVWGLYWRETPSKPNAEVIL